jgi:hypothetical protein
MRLWRLAVRDTHLYPGARLRCLDEADDARFAVGDTALLEFSDGNTVAGEIASTGPGSAVVAVEAHSTRRGASIAAKRWLLQPAGQAGEMRVKARSG